MSQNRDPRLRLLTLITKLELGGAQQVALNTLRRLARDRYRLYLIAGAGGLLDAEARALPDVETHLWPGFKHPIRPLSDLLTLIRLVLFLRRNRIQAIHTHSSKAGFLGRLAAKLAGVPVVVHTVHGWPFHDYQAWPVRWLYILLERLTSRLTDRLVAVSHATQTKGIKEGIGRPDQYTVIVPGSDLSGFAPGKTSDRLKLRRELGIPEAAWVVGMVACLKPQKAPVLFVQASQHVHQRLPAVHFLLVGDGQERPAVEAEVRRLNMENRVHLLGWRKDVAKIMQGLDLFVLTSLWEGLPCVYSQAQASGLAVVASDVEGSREALLPGKTGLLVPANQPQATAEAIIRLLSSEGERQAMGLAGQAFARQFDLETMVRSLDHLYQELLAPTKPEPK